MNNSNRASQGQVFLLISYSLCIFAFGLLFGRILFSNNEVKIIIHEPEVYENLIQQIESYPQITYWTLDRFRGLRPEWRISLRLNDGITIHSGDVSEFEDLHDALKKVQLFIGN